MQQKQRLFIYDRKEMGILILLGLMVAVFAFTLGVHLGKRVNPKLAMSGSVERVEEKHSAVSTEDDALPNAQELTEQAKGATQAADEALDQAAHDEVTRTGLKMDVPRQVDLPEEARTAVSSNDEEHAEPKHEQVSNDKHEISHRLTPPGKFTLQIGSHRFLKEAQDQVNAIEAQGLKPYLRAADIRGKGKWFRVYVGGFSSREAAEKAGATYRSKHLIDSFIIAKKSE